MTLNLVNTSFYARTFRPVALVEGLQTIRHGPMQTAPTKDLKQA